MNNMIRFFALFVAVAGLACATLAPANPQTRFSHSSVAGAALCPLITLPGPISCQEHNTCFAPAGSTR